jgi:hypothetical protein
MKRQALQVSLKELTDLKMQLIKESKDLPVPLDYNRKYQINIINKTGMSDDWELEGFA